MIIQGLFDAVQNPQFVLVVFCLVQDVEERLISLDFKEAFEE